MARTVAEQFIGILIAAGVKRIYGWCTRCAARNT